MTRSLPCINMPIIGYLPLLSGRERPRPGEPSGRPPVNPGQLLTPPATAELIKLLEALKGQIGDLNKVKRIVKVLGMVNAVPTFDQQPKVINGFSDLMVEVFGANGKHARSAVGVGSLPNNIPVEIEMIVELK